MNAKVVVAVAALFVFSITAKAEHIGPDGRPVGLTPAQKSKMTVDIQTANSCGLRLDPNLPEIIDLQLKADLEAQLAAALAADPGAEGTTPPATTDPGAGAPAPGGEDNPDVKKTDEENKDEKTAKRDFNTGKRSTGSSGKPKADDLSSNRDPAALKASANAGIASCMACHDGSGGPSRTVAYLKSAVKDPSKKAKIEAMIAKAQNDLPPATRLEAGEALALKSYMTDASLQF